MTGRYFGRAPINRSSAALKRDPDRAGRAATTTQGRHGQSAAHGKRLRRVPHGVKAAFHITGPVKPLAVPR